ncbi:ABC transporter ATP-binding protein [Caenibacillus caldisaponilyticus]|jgi:ABC-2 type transport system ATP-binding protein|uniref:ABC transporter ATP-binding protein n=1 Tax=Caenibacillus caldisaponilyticus TaxID=1674942 RepID=UPI000988698C|nr:ABC transporter ATP-binding protein [Caenibacillus caldisaponilyticus]
MVQPAIQLKNVKKTIGKKTIIHGLTFDIQPGEVFGFLGPNGAGKTTTIRMICGLMKMTEGDIYIFGHSIKTEFKRAIQHLGAIVENPEFYNHLSGYRNLVHAARMVSGVTKERIDEVVRLVGLQHRIHDKVKTYSLGMRQRLGLAQALLHRPKILILDEPTNGLDPAGIIEIRKYIRRLAEKEGLAIIVSSHLLSEIERMCDRIGIIQNGRLIDVQTVNEFVNADAEMTVHFIVDPVDLAIEVLKSTTGQQPARTGDQLQLSLEREAIPGIVEILVNAGIKLYGITTQKKSLEEKFLEVTGGQQIV